MQPCPLYLRLIPLVERGHQRTRDPQTPLRRRNQRRQSLAERQRKGEASGLSPSHTPTWSTADHEHVGPDRSVASYGRVLPCDIRTISHEVCGPTRSSVGSSGRKVHRGWPDGDGEGAPAQHMDCPPDTMALITSGCGAMRSRRTKRPWSPRVVVQCGHLVMHSHRWPPPPTQHRSIMNRREEKSSSD